MSVNDDLARWGEPPAESDELALAELLGGLLDEGSAAELAPLRGPAGSGLLEASGWVEGVVESVVAHADLTPALAPAPAGAPAAQPAPAVQVWLRLWREAGPGWYVPVAPSPRSGTALRDLRRVPAEAE